MAPTAAEIAENRQLYWEVMGRIRAGRADLADLLVAPILAHGLHHETDSDESDAEAAEGVDESAARGPAYGGDQVGGDPQSGQAAGGERGACVEGGAHAGHSYLGPSYGRDPNSLHLTPDVNRVYDSGMSNVLNHPYDTAAERTAVKLLGLRRMVALFRHEQDIARAYGMKVEDDRLGAEIAYWDARIAEYEKLS